jgi:hypothetical protein
MQVQRLSDMPMWYVCEGTYTMSQTPPDDVLTSLCLSTTSSVAPQSVVTSNGESEEILGPNRSLWT